MLADMEFKYPHNIAYALLAIGAVMFFALAFRKKERIMEALRLGYAPRYKKLMTALLAAGLALMVLALMGPQRFAGYIEVNKSGLDIYILMDTSKSMLVRDVAPDRMSVAKRVAGTLLDSLEGDRIGFIPFASDAYIQMPLTDDYQLARMFLNVMDTDMIGGGGTNLAAAVRLAADSFKRASGGDMVILIISDGEEHDGASIEAIKSVSDTNVKVFTVGVGTDKGGLIPVYSARGDSIIDYVKDSGGNPVTSRLNADTLRRLARDGRGGYYQADAEGSEITGLLRDLLALKRGEYKAERIKRFTPMYQYFLGPGALLFSLAWLLSAATPRETERRAGW